MPRTACATFSLLSSQKKDRVGSFRMTKPSSPTTSRTTPPTIRNPRGVNNISRQFIWTSPPLARAPHESRDSMDRAPLARIMRRRSVLSTGAYATTAPPVGDGQLAEGTALGASLGAAVGAPLSIGPGDGVGSVVRRQKVTPISWPVAAVRCRLTTDPWPSTCSTRASMVIVPLPGLLLLTSTKSPLMTPSLLIVPLKVMIHSWPGYCPWSAKLDTPDHHTQLSICLM